ncbi:hypothetical protein [Arcanobacterium canis]
MREIENRIGPVEIATPREVIAASDEQIRVAAPTLENEKVEPRQVREEAATSKRGPVPAWVSQWSKDFRAGQAKPTGHYINQVTADDEATMEADANQAHLEADELRVHTKKEKEANAGMPETQVLPATFNQKMVLDV